jgi:hypothetical protein
MTRRAKFHRCPTTPLFYGILWPFLEVMPPRRGALMPDGRKVERFERYCGAYGMDYTMMSRFKTPSGLHIVMDMAPQRRHFSGGTRPPPP